MKNKEKLTKLKRKVLRAQPCDRDAVYDATEALIGWCRGGGFLPFDRDSHDWRQNLTRAEFVTYLDHLHTVACAQEVVA